MPEPAPPPHRQRELAIITRKRTPSEVISAATSVVTAVAAVGLILGLLLNLPGIATHQDTLGFLTRGSWGVVGFAAAVGTGSAAVIQIAKQLFGIRSSFQHRWVVEWIGDRSTSEPLWDDWRNRHSAIFPKENPINAKGLADAQHERAVKELEKALLGGMSKREFRRVFDLPIEQLSAQVGIAADLAISQPADYAELLLALAGPARLGEIDVMAPPVDVHDDGRIIRAPAAYFADRNDAAHNSGVDDSTAYVLVAQSVRAGVDMMQISLGQRWRRGVQGSAAVVSGILGVIGAFLLHGSVTSEVLLGVVAFVLGGFFAWLVRDIVAIVERARR